MRAGPLLLTTGIEDHRPLGFAGEPVYLNHRKLAAVVASRLGDGAASYLARPEIDETNRKINWHATVDGEVRRWTDLSPEQRAQLAPRLTALQQTFGPLVDSLERAGEAAHAQENFGRALRLALRSPGVEYLYLVGEHPVLTLWGFEGGAQPFDTLTFNPAVPAAPKPTPAPAVGVPPSPAAVAAARPWWRWLLWLLPLLALLLLALLVLRYCLHEPLPFVEPLLPPIEPLPEERPAEPSVLVPGPAVVPGGPIVDSDGVGVAPDGAPAVPAPLPGTEPPASEAAPEQAQPPPEGTAPETPPAETPAEETPPQETPPEGTPPEETPPEETPPETPGEPPTPPQPEMPPEEAPAEGATPPMPEDGGEQTEPLTLPPPQPAGSADDLDFLQGEWKSDSGLYDNATGKPLTQIYRFGEDGQGQVVIRRADGVECTGAAQAARTEAGGLRIEEAGPIECPDGRRFAPAVTECTRADNGQAQCQGTNRAGSDYDVQISR
jgi:hypothetical protein